MSEQHWLRQRFLDNAPAELPPYEWTPRPEQPRTAGDEWHDAMWSLARASEPRDKLWTPRLGA